VSANGDSASPTSRTSQSEILNASCFVFPSIFDSSRRELVGALPEADAKELITYKHDGFFLGMDTFRENGS
jgi:hypothetical protein